MTTKDRIQSRLNRSKRYVFTRDDFRDIAGYDQVGRALRTLVNEGKLMKVGYGVYTKARRNIITGKIMPAAPGGLCCSNYRGPGAPEYQIPSGRSNGMLQ